MRTPTSRAAHYRLQAKMARKKAETMMDVRARENMLEVAKAFDTLAEIEERITGQVSKEP